MNPLSLLFVGLGLAADAFAVSLNYGLTFQGRKHREAFKIALAFGLFQAGMPVLGWLGGRALKGWIEPFIPWIALLVLGYLGLHLILGAWRNEEPAQISTGFKVLLTLAVATSLDALAVGLLMALLGVSLLLPITVFGVVTFAVSYAGIVGGFEFKSRLQATSRRVVQALGGLALIAIGVRIVLERLTQP